MALNTGQTVDNRYRIAKLLGQGGMGAVYRAWDMRLERPVALKEMVPQFNLDAGMLAELREQFRQEAQTLATLVHPNLVRVTDYFSWDGKEYLVMDFVGGESLADRIEREGAQPEPQVLAWAGHLLGALAYCHRQGVIHRDIKPQNIIITPEEQAVLVDFGLVKLWDPNDPQTRTVMRGAGTPEYAPPEQYDMGVGHTDQRSDIYSVGATLYHALTGRIPPTATQRMASPSTFVPPRHVNASVSPNTEAAVLKALEMAMDRRYQSAEEMAQALGGLARPTAVVTPYAARPEGERGPAAVGVARPTKQRRGILWGMGGASLAIVGGLCLVLAIAAAVLGSSVLGTGGATPTPTSTPTPTATPTSTPTPTPTPLPTATPMPTLDPLPDRKTYTSDVGGFLVDYPGDWIYMEEEAQVIFVNVDFVSSGGEKGALMFVQAGPLEDSDITLEDWWGGAEDEWGGSETKVGKPESIVIGGEDGLIATVEEESIYGWIAVTISSDYGYVFVAATTPADLWKDHTDVFDAMFDSVEFFPPK
jgi:tRNA A-37 threonylcarbamoyl transferase component Bud32